MTAPIRRYARNHIWAELDGERVIVGLSARAVEQLGEVTAFALRVQPGEELAAGQCFASLESAKAEVELFSPLSGAIDSVHESLAVHPELLAEDCYGEGWMIALRPADPAEFTALLDAESYSELLKTASHRA